MKRLVLFTFLASLWTPAAWSYAIPSSCRENKDLGGHARTWSCAENNEAINLQVLSFTTKSLGPSAFEDLKSTVGVKGQTLMKVLNVSDWKVESSRAFTASGGRSYWFSGSYINSENEKTNFVELYVVSPSETQLFLFTRTNSAWTPLEISKRFQIQLQ